MLNRKRLQVFLLVAVFLFTGLAVRAYAGARIVLPQPNMVHADIKSVQEIQALYDGLEDALANRDLDKMMTYYADDYSHMSASKSQLKFLWSEEFGKFEKLYSVHAFTEINVVGDEAAVICTGTLFGLPKGGTEYVVVDSWSSQPHYITRKDGSWKIVGGAAHWKKEPIKGGFRMEFHPFF